MPQVDIDGLNSTLKADVIRGQAATSTKLGGDLDLDGNDITGTGDIPAANLTGTLPAIDGSNLTGISSGADTSLSNLVTAGEERVVHAWASWTVSGTIQDDMNVSSVTDSGTGNYVINFDTSMTNNSYAVCAMGKSDDNGGVRGAYANFAANGDSPDVDSFRIHFQYGNTSQREVEWATAAVFGA